MFNETDLIFCNNILSQINHDNYWDKLHSLIKAYHKSLDYLRSSNGYEEYSKGIDMVAKIRFNERLKYIINQMIEGYNEIQ